MKQAYTIADAKEHVAKYRDEIMANLKNCEEAADWMKNSEHFQQVWQAGCWQNHTLKEHGATDEEVHNVGFVTGQRSSMCADPWKWAVHYLNEWVANKSITDKPGVELADKINNEFFAKFNAKAN